MMDVYDEYQASIVGVQHVPYKETSKYGIVSCNSVTERVFKVDDLVEKPAIEKAPSDIAILGRYIFTPGIFECIENTKPGSGGEIQLTDAMKALIGKEDMYAYDFIGRRYDVGNKMGFLEATVEFALKRDDLKEEFTKYLKSVSDRI